MFVFADHKMEARNVPDKIRVIGKYATQRYDLANDVYCYLNLLKNVIILFLTITRHVMF